MRGDQSSVEGRFAVGRWGLLLVACVVSMLTACYRPAPDDLYAEEEPTGRPWSGASAPVTVEAEASPGSVVPTTTPSPTPVYLGTYSGTPTPDPTPAGHDAGTVVAPHTVRAGETLSLIAALYGCSVEEIVTANGLVNAHSIQAGQTLRIPTNATKTGPSLKLIPDSELVYGPAYADFDLAGFVEAQGGYLAGYSEDVEGELRMGTAIVQLVSQRFSVGPRVLLTLLEMQSGWVTEKQPAGGTLYYPMGHVQAHQEGLFHQLSWAASHLNTGYYGWKRGGRETVRLMSGTRLGIAPELNAGTAGVQNCLAEVAADWDEWTAMIGADGFTATYERLFGNPFAYTVEPLVSEDLTRPELWLPWESGQTWYLTGGPHGGWGTGSGRAAVDFVPGDVRFGCSPSSEWVTAAAPGLVLRSENGQVIVDLDEDGFEQTGWVFLYLHVFAEGRVEEGVGLERGQRIGHPSCEGGASEATHLHFARRYNGEWIPAGSGPYPMVLSGWTVHEDATPYDGTMTRDGEERVACECWEDEINGLVSDNQSP